MYSKFNLIEKVEQVFRLIEEKDVTSWNTIISSCCNCGDHAKSLMLFSTMTEVSAKPDNFTFASVLAACEGLLWILMIKSSRRVFGKNFPSGVCWLHGDAVIGQRLAGILLNLHPSPTLQYVLLSNLYASDEMWNSVADAWKMLKINSLEEEPGHSLIEVEGRVKKFTIGDFSHSIIGEMEDILRRLNLEIMETSPSN
ncbi:E motif [Dillenia turbinata]|uniref:E motif n=1 Tax=Dillenia turbinata TaxID=194707 RepID=A0AAN8WAC7_9MAGN